MASFKIFKTVMRSLFRRPVTVKYPAEPRKWEKITRGHITISEKECIACGICAKKCPTDAISVSKTDRTWTIERMQCIQCNSCVETCPKKCLHMEPDYTAPNSEKVTDTVSIPEQEKKERPKEDTAAEAA